MAKQPAYKPKPKTMSWRVDTFMQKLKPLYPSLAVPANHEIKDIKVINNTVLLTFKPIQNKKQQQVDTKKIKLSTARLGQITRRR